MNTQDQSIFNATICINDAIKGEGNSKVRVLLEMALDVLYRAIRENDDRRNG